MLNPVQQVSPLLPRQEDTQIDPLMGDLPDKRASLPEGIVVYCIGMFSKDFQRVKIGVSKNISRRLEDLQTASPIPLRLIGTIKARSKMHAHEIERRWHSSLKRFRVSGEWFKYNAITREWIIKEFVYG